MTDGIQPALIALRDLGLDSAPTTSLDTRCRAALEHEYTRARARGRTRFRSRRAVIVPLTGALVVALGAVGYAALTGSSTTLSAGIGCYSNGRLDGNVAGTHLDGRPAVETCAELWRSGAVADDGRPQAPPAPLHACVNRDGGGAIHVLVSPDRDVCAQVGMREDPLAGADPAARQYGHFEQGLDAALERPELACPTVAQLQRLVADELHAAGLTGWTTETATPDGCAGLGVDSDARVVTIGP